MERVVNEEKRKKFIEYAGKRVNNVLHDIQILEPMARSNTYDFTRSDVEDMFNAMQETLNDAKEEFNKKFDEKARAEKKTFSFAAKVRGSGMNEEIVTPLGNGMGEQTVKNTTVDIEEAGIVDTITNDSESVTSIDEVETL